MLSGQSIADRLNYVKYINETKRAHENLWHNSEWFTWLFYEPRIGFVITYTYKDPDTGKDITAYLLCDDVKKKLVKDKSLSKEEKDKIIKRKMILRQPESVGDHSGRTANFMSEVLFAYPKLFEGYSGQAIMKVALDHDVGEVVVHDVADDGSKAHELKAEAEQKAVREYYSHVDDSMSALLMDYHRQFENISTFLGQMIKMADKVDAIARLIMFERYDIYGSIYDKKQPSKQDLKFAKEIGTGNCTDVWARHLYGLFHYEHQFEPAVIKIAEDYLYSGCCAVGRPWFKFWPRT